MERVPGVKLCPANPLAALAARAEQRHAEQERSLEWWNAEITRRVRAYKLAPSPQAHLRIGYAVMRAAALGDPQGVTGTARKAREVIARWPEIVR